MNEKIVKRLKKVIHIILGIGIVLSLYQPVHVMAADLSFQNNAISNICNNDARISAQIINSSKMNVTETGFYLGTSSGALSKCSNHDSGNWKYNKITVGFSMSQYWGDLNENTTYYYRFYAIADGSEYTSSEYSFKTTGGNVEKAELFFNENKITDVTENDGRINAKISNPDGRTVTQTGFYIGTSPDVAKNGMNDTCNLTNTTITVGYTMSKYYGTLQPGTTYYYKFYAIGDGQEFCSETYSFTTVSEPQPVTEPTPKPTQEPMPTPTPERPQAPSAEAITEEQQITPESKPENTKIIEGNSNVRIGLSFYDNSVTKVTENDGRINAKISNPDGRIVTQTGFYIGTSPDVSKNGMNDSCNLTNSTITVGYTMSKYYGTLQAGTTYYYKFYAIGDGQEFCSETYSFTTVSEPQPVPEPTPQPVTEPTPTPTPERPQTPSFETTTEGQQGTPASKPESTLSTEGNNSVKTALSFYDNNVTKVTEKDGRVSAKISNPDGRKVTETGFYIGTSEQLYQNAKHDDCNLIKTSISIGFTMSQYYGTLQPETTYYYMYYAVGDGEEFFSDVYSFTTNATEKADSQSTSTGNSDSLAEKKSKITFSVKKVENITYENARIGASVNNPNKENITETGFYYGTGKNNMIKSIDSDIGKWNTGISVSYDVGKYARVCLATNTTYFYQFYVIADGKEVVSEIYSFVTLKNEQNENNLVTSGTQGINKPNVSEEENNTINNQEEGSQNSNKKTYTIKLNANGGVVNPDSIEVVKGEAYGNLPIPVKEGYVFEGWYKNILFWKENVTETSEYKKNRLGSDTLNAKWREKETFYVKFDANGGSVTENMRPVYEQDNIGNLPAPSREGYDFVGWFTESVGGKQVSGDRIILGNEIYYAQWKEHDDGKQIAEEALYWVGKIDYDKSWSIAIDALDHNSPKTPKLDCSAFVRSVYKKYGFNIPNGAKNQIKEGKSVGHLEEIKKGDMSYLKPGDLIFWDYGTDKKPDHVAIYVGNGEIVHSLGSPTVDRGCIKSALKDGKVLDGNKKKVTIGHVCKNKVDNFLDIRRIF